MTLHEEFIKNAIYRINEHTEQLIKCIGNLTEEEIWKRPNSKSNSVGNLLLH